MIQSVKSFLFARFRQGLLREIEMNRLLTGNLQSRLVRAATYVDLHEAEFRVFSQFGEDGLLQYLLGKVQVANKTFIEFGVESYRESNTRFLLVNDNWRGLILDCDDAHEQFLRQSDMIWRHDIRAVKAFITKDNVNTLFRAAGMTGDVGLLCVDIDGNDYWVLDAIDCVSPRILVAEYNSLYGPTRAVTIPYQSDFNRTQAHYSGLYWGASLAAIHKAAQTKNLALVACTSAGNNAFFVRRDLLGSLKECTPAEAYVEARYRESRDREGRLTLIGDRAEKLRTISDCPLVDLDAAGQVKPVGELYA